MNRLITSFMLSLLFIPAAAQSFTTSFGGVTREELSMTHYEPDTSAPAVILYKSGHFSSSSLEFTHYIRIKVLREEGTGRGEFAIRTEMPSSVKGMVHNLSGDDVEEVPLSNESIFRERLSPSVWLVRIAMPDVREGSVIELEYREQLLPGSFRFQEDIPVKRAELNVELSDIIEFRQTQTGYEQVNAASNTFFYAEDVPAFRPEPFISSVNNYITKFDFDILTITMFGQTEFITTSWDVINRGLMRSPGFGSVMEARTRYIRDIARAIEAGYDDEKARLRAAYDTIRTAMSWNSRNSIYVSNDNLSRVLRDGAGNVADINFILFHLLQRMDISSSVVILSTRANGILNPYFPATNRLNYLIVRAEVDGDTWLLDATERHLPFGLLPSRVLNERGRTVDRGFGTWVEIDAPGVDREVVTYNVTLGDDGQVRGDIEYHMEEYAAFNFRNLYHMLSGDEAFVESYESRKDGLTVMEFDIEGADSIYMPCRLVIEGSLSGHAQAAGSTIILYPLLAERMNESPFRVENREYPVDYTYGREKDVVVNITIPDGYEVEQMPENFSNALRDEVIAASMTFEEGDNGLLTISYSFRINRPRFLPEEYGALRAFYEELVAQHSKPVILRRVEDGEE